MKFPFISRWAHEQIIAAKEEILRLKDAQIAELKEQAEQLSEIITGAPIKKEAAPQQLPSGKLDTSVRPGPYAPLIPGNAPDAPKGPEEKARNPLDTDIPFSVMRRGSVYTKAVSARNSRSYNHSALKDHASKLLEAARHEGIAAVEEGRRMAETESVTANG